MRLIRRLLSLMMRRPPAADRVEHPMLPPDIGDRLYVSLHVRPPLDQCDGECAWRGYHRLWTSRSPTVWEIVTADRVARNRVPLAVGFNMSDSEQVATWVGIGTKPVGPGTLIFASPLRGEVVVRPGQAFLFEPGQLEVPA